MTSIARAKFLDPDFRPRRNQGEGSLCCRCGRVIKSGQRRRRVRLLDSAFVLHPQDPWRPGEPVRIEHSGDIDRPGGGGPASASYEDTGELGPDCAKWLGLEWSTEQQEKGAMSHVTRQVKCGLYEGHRLSDGMEIWAVGKTPLEACDALARERWGGTVEKLGAPLPGDDTYDWGYRFWSDGTSFKAAGVNVPGGVILTWWK